MIRINTGDLLCVNGKNKYYYVLILDKTSLFGGQLCYVYHKTTTCIIDADEIINSKDGFYEIIDFIWAKRENNINKLKSNIDIKSLKDKLKFYKQSFTLIGKADKWRILDLEGNQIKIVDHLNSEQKKYPLYHRIDTFIMMDLVEKEWLPEKDERI